MHVDVGGRVGADPVPPHPPVELLLAGRHRVRAPAGGRSRAPRRRAARPRGSSGSGRSGRRAARRWRRPARTAGTPRRRRWTAGRPAGRPPRTATRRPAWSCRPGPARSGRPARRSVPSGSRTSRAACSWPGSRRVKNARPAAPDRDADAAGAQQLLSRAVSRRAPRQRVQRPAASASWASTTPACAGRPRPPATGTGRRPVAVQLLDQVEARRRRGSVPGRP